MKPFGRRLFFALAIAGLIMPSIALSAAVETPAVKSIRLECWQEDAEILTLGRIQKTVFPAKGRLNAAGQLVYAPYGGSRIVALLAEDTVLTLLSPAENFYRVRLEDGTEGYIHSRVVAVETSANPGIVGSYVAGGERRDRFRFTIVANRPAKIRALCFMVYPKGGHGGYSLLEGRYTLNPGGGSTTTVELPIDTRGLPLGSYTIAYWIECDEMKSQYNEQTKPYEEIPKAIYNVQDITVGVESPDPEYVSKDRAMGAVKVVALRANAYANKSLAGAGRAMAAGDIVDLIYDRGGISKFYYERQIYYMPSTQLMAPTQYKAKDNRQGTIALALEIALQQRGCAYWWGGGGGDMLIAGRPVFDCSGLSYYCFRNAGLGWGRMTATSQSACSYVNRLWMNPNGPLNDMSRFLPVYNSMKPGDLVGFQTSTTPNRANNISHIGIYLGNGKMIHAGDPIHVESYGPYASDFLSIAYGPRARSISRFK